jgi:hypothetical protein
MKHNVGGWDRKVRWSFGSLALVLGLFGPWPKAWRTFLVLAGATDLLTAGTGYCPINQALGVNTRRDTLSEAAKKAKETIKAFAA